MSKTFRNAFFTAFVFFALFANTAHAAGPNLVSNPSFEDGATTTPTAWVDGSNGTSTRTVTTVSPGHTGLRAGEVSVTSYADGDVKWSTDAIPVTEGQHYVVSNWYKGSIPTILVVFYNETQFVWLADIPAALDWTQTPEISITIPSGVTTARVAHLIEGVGTLTTDDYMLALDTSPTFPAGTVTLTFDDGWKSISDNAIPVLDAKGLKSTQYIYTQAILEEFEFYMSSSTLRALQTTGHEVAAHSRTHADLTLSGIDLASEIAGSKSDLIAMGLTPVETFAYPYGNYCAGINTDCATLDLRPTVQTAGFVGARSVDQGYNFIDDNKYTLKIQHVTNLTTSAEIRSWINTATSTDAWLILMFHEVHPTLAGCVGGDEECTTTGAVEDMADYLSTNAVSVITMSQGLALMNGTPPPPDTTAPVITTPASPVTVTATTPAGATVAFSVSATDAVDPAPVVSCTPASGTTFAIGDTTVNCTATDASTNSASASFVVSVVNNDTTGPTVVVSSTATNPTNLAAVPVTVTFNENATGFDESDLVVTGGTVSAFANASTTAATFTVTPIGDGTITVSVAADAAADAFNNLSSPSNDFSIVVDTTQPVITLVGASSLVVPININFIDPGVTATDATDGDITAHVVVSGDSVVSPTVLGTYTMRYNVTDSSLNAATEVTRTVTVVDLLISDEGGATPTSDTLTITWDTSHPATSRVVWDTVPHTTESVMLAGAPNYGYANSTVEDVSLVTHHSVTIHNGINSETTYYVRTISHGSPEVIGSELTFTTPIKPLPILPSGGGGGCSSCGGGGGGTVIGLYGASNTSSGQVLGASTQSLTDQQIEAILNLLRSFDADQSVINSVNNALRGVPVSQSTGGLITQTLRVGSSGAEVLELQKRLTLEGVYSGPHTGYFGPLTEAGVIAYQGAHGIPQTGVVGPLTRAALNGQ